LTPSDLLGPGTAIPNGFLPPLVHCMCSWEGPVKQRHWLCGARCELCDPLQKELGIPSTADCEHCCGHSAQCRGGATETPYFTVKCVCLCMCVCVYTSLYTSYAFRAQWAGAVWDIAVEFTSVGGTSNCLQAIRFQGHTPSCVYVCVGCVCVVCVCVWGVCV
jgi:hypothetical protein